MLNYEYELFGYHVKYFVNMFSGIHAYLRINQQTDGQMSTASSRNHATQQNSADIHVNYCHERRGLATPTPSIH